MHRLLGFTAFIPAVSYEAIMMRCLEAAIPNRPF